jgi:hypothetical protein
MDKEAHNYDVCMPGSPLHAQLLAVAALLHWKRKQQGWVLGMLCR